MKLFNQYFQPNLLITSAGGMHSQRLLKAIKKKTKFRNLKIHIVDKKKIKKNQKNFHDTSETIPSPKKKYNYYSRLKKIIHAKKINIIIPGSDEESIILSEIKSKYDIFISSPEKKFLDIHQNKFLMMKKLKKEKISNLKFYKITSKKILEEKILLFTNKKKDFVIKPIYSRGGRGVYIISQKQKKNIIYLNKKRETCLKLSYFLNQKNFYVSQIIKNVPLLLMEKLYQPAMDVDFLTMNGKLINFVLRKRIGSQAEKGSIILKNNNIVKNIVKKISKIFNLSGIFDCDLMFDDKKKITIMEINPRISGSLYASIFSKINLIDDLISIVLLKKKPEIKIQNRQKKVLANQI